jgi:thiol-disulfide isomerase/thioredoxin
MRKTIPRVVLLACAFFAACRVAEASKVGESLPDLRLNFLGPNPDYENKPILLEFWATWCSPCRESIPHLNELHAKYKDRGLVIIGVTDEPSGVIRKFQRDTPMDYAVATDSGGKLNKDMGVDGIPHAFLADTSGKIVWDGHPMSLREGQIEEVLGGHKELAVQPAGNPATETEAAMATATSGSPVSAEASAAESSEPAARPDAAAELVVIQAEDTAAMQSKVGSEVIIEGLVKNVGKGPNDGITFINFGDRKTGFVAVIFRPAYDKFPEGFDKYANQKVRVKGALENFRDRQMQMKIFTPDQLEIVASEP